MDELPFWAEISISIAAFLLLDWAVRPERLRHWLGIICWWVGVVSIFNPWGWVCLILGWRLWYHSDRHLPE
ncbi:hypothetical protein ACIPZF_02705 [Pseudomonas sp. NPDC089752]|uniref:hypothetical protein n=1 Tax=Pseudomonas sp. NPDC089752 TaxID=3364472 RepID=UPI0038043F4F